MREHDEIMSLIGHLQKTQILLGKIITTYQVFCDEDLKILGKKQTTAMTLAELLVDYYTCLETLFLRISQLFENGLSKERWHSDLLEKMTIEIPHTRKAFINDLLKRDLDELLRFRHFRRYYFELEYDWDKLDFLAKKLLDIHSQIPEAMNAYTEFLESVANEH